MSDRATEKELAELHNDLAKALSERVKSKACTAAELNVARQFLKDNGIEATAPKDSALFNVTKDMPEFDGDVNIMQ